MSATGKYMGSPATALSFGPRPGRRILAVLLAAFLWAAPAAAQVEDLWEPLLDQPFWIPEDCPEEASADSPPAPGLNEPWAEAPLNQAFAPLQEEPAAAPPPPTPSPAPSREASPGENAPPEPTALETTVETGGDSETAPDSLGWLDDYDWLADPEPKPASASQSPLTAEPSAGPVASSGSFEELLAAREDREFQHEGRTYLWRDGVPFEKNEDGTLSAVTPPENLYEVGTDGRKWLSREADGTIYINVAPKVWATINFAHDSAVIEDSSKPVLDVFGASLSTPALVRHRLVIAGHTNSLGRPEYNLTLSRRRARSVARYLADSHHIEPDRLILHGYGDQRPIADNGAEEGLARNRRVEFILLGPPADQYDDDAGN